MTIKRRTFLAASSGAFIYSSAPQVLAQANLSGKKPIIIANLLDRTGVFNNYCLKQIDAIALGVDEINKSGGLLDRPVVIKFYDTQSNGRLYSQYATHALTRDKADVLIGAVASSDREVLRPIIRKFKSIYFYNALYEGGVCDRRTFPTGMIPSQAVSPLVDYVVNERNRKKHYILAADYNYGQITAKWIEKYIKDQGGSVLKTEFFPLDVTNFAAVLSRIQDAKPDAVWSALVGDAHVGFYNQFEATIGKRNMDLASPVYGAARENIMVNPESNNGVILSGSFFDFLERPESKSFVEKFRKFTGENDYIGEYGEYGYRSVALWAEGVRKAGTVAADKVIDAMGGVTVEGAGGTYVVSPRNNHVSMDIHIAEGNLEKGFDIIKSFKNQSPIQENDPCNLIENPNDITQYEPGV